MSSWRGVLRVTVLEAAKLSGQARVAVLLGLCVVAPVVLVAVLVLQSATPTDTLFGRWVHVSGLAVPLVVMGFASQWAFPALAGLVAADIFAAEDRHHTWKLLLSRSRTRTEVFVGKTVVALAFAVLTAVLTVASSLAAGLLVVGGGPLVNLSGFLVPVSSGAALVIASGLVQLPPMLAMAAFALMLSVLTRNTLISLAGPVLLGLAGQLGALMDMPPLLRMVLPAGAFGAWRGLWLDHQLTMPIWVAAVTSLAVVMLAVGLAAVVFLRRDVTLR